MELDWGKGDVILVDGQEVAHTARSWFRERAEVQIGPELWSYCSAGWGSGTLLAELDGTAHYSARRTGLFSRRWTFDTGQLELTQAGFLSSRLRVGRGGAQIGEVTRSGIFTSRPRMTLAETLDVRVGCFVLWIAYVELNRQSNDGA